MKRRRRINISSHTDEFQIQVMETAIRDYAKQILELQNKKIRAEKSLRDYRNFL